MHTWVLAKHNDLLGIVTEWNHKEVIGFGEGPQKHQEFYDWGEHLFLLGHIATYIQILIEIYLTCTAF